MATDTRQSRLADGLAVVLAVECPGGGGYSSFLLSARGKAPRPVDARFEIVAAGFGDRIGALLDQMGKLATTEEPRQPARISSPSRLVSGSSKDVEAYPSLQTGCHMDLSPLAEFMGGGTGSGAHRGDRSRLRGAAS